MGRGRSEVAWSSGDPRRGVSSREEKVLMALYKVPGRQRGPFGISCTVLLTRAQESWVHRGTGAEKGCKEGQGAGDAERRLGPHVCCFHGSLDSTDKEHDLLTCSHTTPKMRQ